MQLSNFARSLVLVASACSSQPAPAPDAAASVDITGTWRSSCVDTGQGGIRLDFQISSDSWALDYRAFADAACTSPLLVVAIDGPYALSGPSAVVAGATEGRFAFAHKTVTPLADGAVGFLEQACNGGTYVVGAATDIAGGCAGLGAYPIATCPADHDVVARDGDQLRFGERPADNNMCTPDRRPTALSSIVLERR